jgi:hypothetical protein
MAITVIKKFYDNVINKLSSIDDFSYVIQYQNQDIDQENTSLYSYPAILVEVDVENVTQMVRRSDYNCNLLIHLLEKEMNHDMYGGLELVNKIYDSLQGQHFTQSCSPLYYTDMTIDKKPLNFSKTVLEFKTIITYNSVNNPNIGITHSVGTISGTFSFIGQTQSVYVVITQSNIN